MMLVTWEYLMCMIIRIVLTPKYNNSYPNSRIFSNQTSSKLYLIVLPFMILDSDPDFELI